MCVLDVNIKVFEECKVDLVLCNDEICVEVQVQVEKLDGQFFVIICLVLDVGVFYGLVILCDVVEVVVVEGFVIECCQVVLIVLIKDLGLYEVCVYLYLEVDVMIMLNVVCLIEEVEL